MRSRSLPASRPGWPCTVGALAWPVKTPQAGPRARPWASVLLGAIRVCLSGRARWSSSAGSYSEHSQQLFEVNAGQADHSIGGPVIDQHFFAIG